MKPSTLQATVGGILEDVRRRGDRALRELTLRHDGLRLASLRVPNTRIRNARRGLPPDLRRSLVCAARRIEAFHREEKRRTLQSWLKPDRQGATGQIVRPVDSAGLYVPGGRFSYPSTVLMAAIPARVAGVRRIALATPPKRLDASLLAAAAIAGVDEVYSVGGPGAIAAFAYGTRSIPRVDLIAGPGNAWVTEAKRQVFGTVGIDSLAGPSELVIIADDTAAPAALALDLAAQAEHDPAAMGALFSPSALLLRRVRAAVPGTLRSRCRFLRVRSLAEAIQHSNALAPEHLEIVVREPRQVLKGVRHAGAVFLGPWSPAVAGDYWAGPSHVLPTAGSARFASGLSVQTFLKRSSVIMLSRSGFLGAAGTLERIARQEGLSWHERSAKIRRLDQR